MRRDEVKSLVEAHGPEAFTYKLVDLLGQGKVKPEQVSIRGLYEAMVGCPEDTIHGIHAGHNRLGYIMPRSRKEEVGSTMFPVASGALIAAKVIQGYEAVGYIAENLVEFMDSKHKVETMVGFTALDGPKEVAEGKDYEDSDIGEKFVTMQAAKRGRLIAITEEAILFDQTGQLLLRAQRLGERVRLDMEKRILKAVTGNDGQAYKPSNAATDIYSSGNKNQIAANALVDWQNVDACLKQTAKQEDEKAEIIVVNTPQLLVPRALLGTALRVTSATQIRQHDPVVAPQVATYSPSPFSGMFTPLSSPLMDSLSGTGATDWFMGDFKKAFIYQRIYPLQTLAAIAGNPDEFKKDIKYLYKVREFGGVACIDHRYVYRNQA